MYSTSPLSSLGALYNPGKMEKPCRRPVRCGDTIRVPQIMRLNSTVVLRGDCSSRAVRLLPELDPSAPVLHIPIVRSSIDLAPALETFDFVRTRHSKLAGNIGVIVALVRKEVQRSSLP